MKPLLSAVFMLHTNDREPGSCTEIITWMQLWTFPLWLGSLHLADEITTRIVEAHTRDDRHKQS